MYRFDKLRFVFAPSSSTGTSGSVTLGFDFDVLDESPTKATMLCWKYSSRSALWSSSTLDVSSDSRSSTYRYCNYASPGNGDSRLDDLGALFVYV